MAETAPSLVISATLPPPFATSPASFPAAMARASPHRLVANATPATPSRPTSTPSAAPVTSAPQSTPPPHTPNVSRNCRWLPAPSVLTLVLASPGGALEDIVPVVAPSIALPVPIPVPVPVIVPTTRSVIAMACLPQPQIRSTLPSVLVSLTLVGVPIKYAALSSCFLFLFLFFFFLFFPFLSDFQRLTPHSLPLSLLELPKLFH